MVEGPYGNAEYMQGLNEVLAPFVLLELPQRHQQQPQPSAIAYRLFQRFVTLYMPVMFQKICNSHRQQQQQQQDQQQDQCYRRQTKPIRHDDLSTLQAHLRMYRELVNTNTNTQSAAVVTVVVAVVAAVVIVVAVVVS